MVPPLSRAHAGASYRIRVLALDERNVDDSHLSARKVGRMEHELDILTVRRGDAAVEEHRGSVTVTRLEVRGLGDRLAGRARRGLQNMSARWEWLEKDAPVVRIQLAARRIRAVGSSCVAARWRQLQSRRQSMMPSDRLDLAVAVAFALAARRIAAASPPNAIVAADRGASPAVALLRATCGRGAR